MTLQTITPSLWLAPGKAGEAGKLYAELFADASIESHDFLENPAGPEYNAEMLQVRIGSSRLQIMGAHRDPMVEYTDAISLSVVVADQASLDKVWDGFLERGGQEQACSWIIDPYGVRWQVLPQAFYDLTSTGDAAQAQRVTEALWKMVRIDVEGLETAARG